MENVLSSYGIPSIPKRIPRLANVIKAWHPSWHHWKTWLCWRWFWVVFPMGHLLLFIFVVRFGISKSKSCPPRSGFLHVRRTGSFLPSLELLWAASDWLHLHTHFSVCSSAVQRMVFWDFWCSTTWVCCCFQKSCCSSVIYIYTSPRGPTDLLKSHVLTMIIWYSMSHPPGQRSWRSPPAKKHVHAFSHDVFQG